MEVEDEDNASHHLYFVNRMVVAEDEAFPDSMFRMSWMGVVVALVAQEVSPWWQFFLLDLTECTKWIEYSQKNE